MIELGRNWLSIPSQRLIHLFFENLEEQHLELLGLEIITYEKLVSIVLASIHYIGELLLNPLLDETWRNGRMVSGKNLVDEPIKGCCTVAFYM